MDQLYSRESCVMKCNKGYLCSKYCHDLEGSIWSALTAIFKDDHITSFAGKVDLANTNIFKDGNMGSCNPILLDNSNMLRISLQLAPSENFELCLSLADVANSTIQINRKEDYLEILLPFFKKSSCQSRVMISAVKNDVTLFGERKYFLLDCQEHYLMDLTINFKLNNWLFILASSQLEMNERGDSYTGMTAASASIKSTIYQMILHAFNHVHDCEECLKRIWIFLFRTKEIGIAIMVYVNSIRLNFDDGSVQLCVCADR